MLKSRSTNRSMETFVPPGAEWNMRFGGNMSTESTHRFGMSPIVFGNRMFCSQSTPATRFALQRWMILNVSEPEQAFRSKDSSTLGYKCGLGLRKTDWSEGSHRQNLASSRVNAAKHAAETMPASPTTSKRNLPAAIYTTGLGAQYALAMNLATSPVSDGLVAENEALMEKLKALAKLATLRQGRILESKVFRQTYVIRSYEVGPDGTTSIDTLMSLFQEVALNHVSLLGIAGDGFGATLEMNRYRLIWVITRLHVEVERYPSWPEIVEIDSWTDCAGKSGMRRDWLVREEGTGVVIAKATSTWAMINQDTRRLSKMPQDVRAEISPTFVQRYATEESLEKIPKLDDTAKNIQSNLTPCRANLDGNLHVNNVTYIGWVMKSTPKETLENRRLSSMTLEFRRECNKDDIVQSLTDIAQKAMQGVDSTGSALLESPSILADCRPLNVNSMSLNGTGILSSVEDHLALECCPTVAYTHLLRMQLKGEAIVRGRTAWKPKCPRQQKV